VLTRVDGAFGVSRSWLRPHNHVFVAFRALTVAPKLYPLCVTYRTIGLPPHRSGPASTLTDCQGPLLCVSRTVHD
jgi:hypothetical protein